MIEVHISKYKDDLGRTDSFALDASDHGGIVPAFRLLAQVQMTDDLLRHFYRTSTNFLLDPKA